MTIPTGAWAQTQPQLRPYRGLFGSPGSDAGEALALNASVGGGYETNLMLGDEGLQGDALSPWRGAEGGFGQVSGRLDYHLYERRATVLVNGGALVSRYQHVGQRFFGLEDESGMAAFQLTRRTRLTIAQTIVDKPYFVFDLLSAAGVPPAGSGDRQVTPPAIETADVQGNGVNTLAATSTVDLTRSIRDRGALSFVYGARAAGSTDPRFRMRAQSGGARWSQFVSRYASVHLGYEHEQGTTGSGISTLPVQLDTFDTGFGYDRPRSPSRRTAFAFGSGATMYRDGDHRQTTITGRVRLDHDMGRSWTMAASYGRGVSLIEVFRRPAASNEVALGLSGWANRRVECVASAAALTGVVGASATNNGFQMYRGSLGVTVGLARDLALATSYTYSRYLFESTDPLPAGIWREFAHHTVRMQLETYLPLFEHGRRPDAPR